MAHVWQTDPSPRTPREDRGTSFKGLRSFEHHWRRLGVAATHGDTLEMAAASASAARACLTDGDLDEAAWHLQRSRRFLHAHRACARSLALQCELAKLGLRLADRLALDDEHAARRLREETRDDVFELVRRAGHVADRGAVAVSLLEVADVLEALGDDSDAETVRLQALRGLGCSNVAQNIATTALQN